MDKNKISQIRKELEGYVGKRIQLKANKGRKKIFIKEGIVDNVYPCIFTVKFENDFNNSRRVSFSYTDVLTKTVEIKVMPSSDCQNIAL